MSGSVGATPMEIRLPGARQTCRCSGTYGRAPSEGCEVRWMKAF